MRKIVVLGAGMVGSAMALDLVKQHKVTLTDISTSALEKALDQDPNLTVQLLDAQEHEHLRAFIQNFDLVVCAVPGYMGYNTLKSIIEAGKNVVDISFFPEEASTLHELALNKGVCAVVDCGVAPGMDNMILGYHTEQMKVERFECLVGGLPKEKKWPFCYKAPFSPTDVIEEYTRPARYVENGKVVVREALSDCEHVDIEGVGTLEAFNSDGLRSLITSFPHIPHMKEKTLRYPGHAEYIKVLRESGFFDASVREINGKMIRPIDFTSQILFNEWKLGEQEQELTVMRITIEGRNHDGAVQKIVYHLYDEYCLHSNKSSMARTTGYTATAVANLMLEGGVPLQGIVPPELVGKQDNAFQYVLNYLDKRDVTYTKRVALTSQASV